MELSLISATYNAIDHIKALARDVHDQTDQDFSWVIVDGGSTDGTVEFLRSVARPQDSLISERDFGIYDALNKGIQRSNGRYYVVAGADDRIFPDNVKTLKRAIASTNADVIAASVKYQDRILRPNTGSRWRKGQNALISNHSIATAFRKALHDDFGWYTRRLPICADQLFVRTVDRGGATFHFLPEHVAGHFGDAGLTHSDYFGTLTEFTRVQLKFERYASAQLMLFAYRCIKNLRKIL